MPQDGVLLDQIARGYAPVITGRPHIPMTGMEGFPGMGGGMGGLAAQFVLAPILQRMMGQHGYMPMGLGHDQNVYDVMRNMQFTRAQEEAMRMASEQDAQNYMQTLRGISAMTGTPWGTQQRRAARHLGDMMGQFAPMMAQIAPEMLDIAGGMRGSAVVMAQRMMMGGRYQLDPVTGRMGMTGESAGFMANRLYEDLFRQGDISQMRGLTAGQFGAMYDELGRRGMILGPQQPIAMRTMRAVQELAREDRGALNEAAQQQNVTLPDNLQFIDPADLDKLRLDPAIADKIRGFDSERVKRSLKDYAGIVSTMRDIFGDLGRPDAPMAELIQKLEALTQGGTSQLDPGRLNMMVRTTHEIARQSGISLDAALAIQQHAAGRAQQLGISPLHAIQGAQGAMAWGNAFTAQGGAAVPAWGRRNAAQQIQLDANLRMQAAASEQAQRLGALMRVRETIGGFQEGSRAEAIAQAVMAGQTEYLDPTTGETRTTLMDRAQFFDLMAGAKGVGGQELGLDRGRMSGMLGQTFANEEQINRWNIGGIVRRQMPQEARAWVRQRYRETIANQLRGRGMEADAAWRAAGVAAERVTERAMGMRHEQFANTAERNEAIATTLQTALQDTEAAGAVAGLGQDWFELAAAEGYGHVQYIMRRDPNYRQYGSFQDFQAQMNRRTLQQGERNLLQARLEARTADSLTALGRGGAARRAIDYLQQVRGDDNANIPELIAHALGVKTGDVNKGLQEGIIGLDAARAEVDRLKTEIQASPEGPARQRLMEQFNAANDVLREQANTLADMAAEQGFASDESQLLGTRDVERTQATLERMFEQSRALTADKGLQQRFEIDADVVSREAKRTGLSEAQVRERMSRRRWNEFMDTDEGRHWEETVDYAMQDISDLAHRAIMDDRTLRKLGPQGLRMYEQLRGGQEQLQTLANYYAGGDVARLMAGQFDRSKIRDAEHAEQIWDDVQAVSGQLQGTTSQMGDVLGRIAKGENVWGDDARATALDIMGLGGADAKTLRERAGEIAAMERSINIAKQLTDKDLARLDEFRETQVSAEKLAKRYATVTQEEVDKYLAGDEAKQRGITTAEAARAAIAAHKVGLAIEGKGATPDMLKPLTEEELGKVREARDAYSKAYAEYKQADAKGDVAARDAAKQRTKDALKGIEGLANQRGVKALDLAYSGDRYTEGQINLVKGRFDEAAKMQEDIEKEIGGRVEGADTIGDLREGEKAIDAIMGYAEGRREQETMTAPQHVERLMELYGFDTKKHKDLARELGGSLSTEAGLIMARRATRGTEDLKRTAEIVRKRFADRGHADAKKLLTSEDDKLAGVRYLSERIAEETEGLTGKKRQRAIDKLQKEWGLTASEMRGVQEDVRFLDEHSFLGMIDPKSLKAGDSRRPDLSRAVRSLVGEAERGGPPGGDNLMRIEGRMEVDLVNGVGDMDAEGRTGGK